MPSTLLFLFVSVFLAGTLTAQVRVDALLWQTGDQLVINFSDETPATAGDFTVETSTELTAESWTLLDDATVEARPGGGWRATVSALQNERRAFFRIVKGRQAVTAVFEVESTEVREGSGAGIRVQFSGPFSGTLNYSLDSGSGPVPGQVTATGGSSVVIPIPGLTDDAVADELAYLNLRLLEGAGYTLSGFGMAIIVADNDALWGGFLDSEEDDVNIAVRMLTVEQDGVKSACLKTDGAGLLPPNPSGDGNWLFSAFTLTDTVFTGTVGPIIIPAEESVHGEPTHLTLSFDSAGGSVEAGRLEGSFSLATSVPALPHLSFPTRSGTFVFLRQAAAPVDLEAPIAAP